jgi:hypothetical protein
MSISALSEEDLRFMRRAIELAHMVAAIPGASPIGCVIVRNGQILGEGHNEVDIRHDPTAHAEIVAMRRVGGALGLCRFSRRYALFHAPAVRHLQHGVDLEQDRPHRIRRRARRMCTACISRTATSTRSTSSPTPSATILS